MNESLEKLRAHVVHCLSVQETHGMRRALDLLDAVPELQGCCATCCRESDHQEPDGRYVGTDPVTVVRCTNGCRGCSECVTACEEGTCSLAVCRSCSVLCERCGSRFCREHIVNDPDSSDSWCYECCPGILKRKLVAMEAGDRAYHAAAGA